MEREYEIIVRLHNDQDRVVKILRFKIVSNATIMKYLAVPAGRKFREVLFILNLFSSQLTYLVP